MSEKKTIPAWLEALLLLVVVLGWVSAVSLPAWNVVLRGDEVRLLGSDPHHHLRHVRVAVENFPRMLRWDTGIFYPKGHRSESVGTYQWLVAAAALVFGGGHPSPKLVAQVTAWSPVFFSVLLLLILYGLARRLTGSPWAICAPLLVLFGAGPLASYSTLGFADHHLLEAVLLSGSTWAAYELSRSSPAMLKSMALGLPLLLFQFSWPAACVYILLIGFGLTLALIELVATRDRAALEEIRGSLAAFGLGQLLIYSGLIWLLPDLVMLQMTRLPTILGYLGLGLGLPLVAWALLQIRWPGSPRLGQLVLLAAGLLLLVGALTPQGSEALGELLSPKTSAISEHRPVTPLRVWSYFGLLAPLALLGLWWGRKTPRFSTVAGVGVGMFALWVITRDFSYLVPPFVALFATLAIVSLPPRPRVAALLVALLIPTLGLVGARRPFRSEQQVEQRAVILVEGWKQALTWLRTRTPQPDPPVNALVPPWPGGDYQYGENSYGVLCAWDFGHLVVGLGERPVVYSQSLSSAWASFWLHEKEEPAYRQLRDLCRKPERVGYVVIDCRTVSDYFVGKVATAGKEISDYLGKGAKAMIEGETFELPVYNEHYESTLGVRLQLDDGLGLGHFRLVYESPARSLVTYVAHTVVEGDGEKRLSGIRRTLRARDEEEMRAFERLGAGEAAASPAYGYLYGGQLSSEVKIYQVVRGAVLAGRARPGSTVTASLPLRTNTGRSFVYHTEVQTEESGFFRLTVPYSTESGLESDQVHALGAYRVTCGDRQQSIPVSPAEIEKGAEVTVGGLAPSAN